MTKLILLVTILPVIASLCNGPPREDSECGPGAGGASCADPVACCSRFGFCGVGVQWCNKNSLCAASSSTSGNATTTRPNSGTQRVGTTAAPVRLPTVVSTRNQSFRTLTGCGQGNRVVALTFDDGPQPGANPNLLQELRTNSIKATFFSSPQANGPEQLTARCDLVKSILGAGHQLEQHSMTHPHFPTLTPDQLATELSQSAQFLKSCGANITIFRPPYGELTAAQTTRVLTEFALPIALWNVDPRDYEGAGVAVNFQRVVSEFETMIGVGNSAVVLLHELTEGQTSGLVTKLASYFRGLGYSFVTLDQCIKTCKKSVCSGPDDFPDIIGAATALP